MRSPSVLFLSSNSSHCSVLLSNDLSDNQRDVLIVDSRRGYWSNAELELVQGRIDRAWRGGREICILLCKALFSGRDRQYNCKWRCDCYCCWLCSLHTRTRHGTPRSCARRPEVINYCISNRCRSIRSQRNLGSFWFWIISATPPQLLIWSGSAASWRSCPSGLVFRPW